MAELSVVMRDNEKATHLYKEALNLSPSEPDILLALAKLYMQVCRYIYLPEEIAKQGFGRVSG